MTVTLNERPKTCKESSHVTEVVIDNRQDLGGQIPLPECVGSLLQTARYSCLGRDRGRLFLDGSWVLLRRRESLLDGTDHLEQPEYVEHVQGQVACEVGENQPDGDRRGVDSHLHTVKVPADDGRVDRDLAGPHSTPYVAVDKGRLPVTPD